jgi:hypothetical protein
LPKKEIAVNFFRCEKRNLRVSAFALILPVSTLDSWNKEFDENMKPYKIPDKRGKSTKVTPDIVRKIVDEARSYADKNSKIRIKKFTRELHTKHGIKLSSKTVGDILIANDLRNPQTRRKRPNFYQSLKQNIPNGLLSIDGSEFIIWIDGKPLKFNVEMSVDVNSFTHTAFSISSSETTEEYIKVIESHCSQWGNPLGVLCDHGSANFSNKAKSYLKSKDIEFVPAGPYNPKGNGIIENAFGQMKEILGKISIDTSSPQKLAKSVLESIISVYIKMRNKLSLHGSKNSPVSRINQPVTEEDKTRQRKKLQEHNQKRIIPDEDKPKLNILNFMIKNQAMEVSPEALERAEKTIIHYELEAIVDTEKAFIKAVSRKSDRLNLPYFFGILKRIQEDRDNQTYARHCQARYNYDQMLKNEERQREIDELQKPPEVRNVIGILQNHIKYSVPKIKEVTLRKAKQWIGEMVKNCRYIKPLKKKFEDAIAKLSHLSNEQKEIIWNIIESEIDLLTKGKSVTPIS